LFPNTTPLVNGPSAPTAQAGVPSFTQAANYMNPGLSATQMMQSSPYTQYQQATQNMQQQMQNMKTPGVGTMAMQGQGQGGGQPGAPGAFGPFGNSNIPPPQSGGY
jgi:hypothetical protein